MPNWKSDAKEQLQKQKTNKDYMILDYSGIITDPNEKRVPIGKPKDDDDAMKRRLAQK